MSNDIKVTVTGNAGSKPTIRRSERGTEWTSFSVASTRRIKGPDGEYVDGPTLWFQVKAWGHAAANIAESVEKGQPLMVAGRLELNEWMSDTGPRTTLVINADCVGQNLMRGRARFTRVVASAAEPDGAPFTGDARRTAGGSAENSDPWNMPGLAPIPGAVPGGGHDVEAFAGPSGAAHADSGHDEDLTA